jgi:hypothetical protein
MEKTLPMPLQARRNPKTGDSLRDTLRRFSQSGRSWVLAEAALAKAELASDGRRLGVIVAIAALAIGTLLAAIMLFALFLVSLLAPYVGGLANAAGILALVLLLVTGLAVWRAWAMARAELGLVSLLKRWADVASKSVGRET